MARYRFSGPCEFDSATGEVHRQDFVTRLEPHSAALLALLADRAGEIVAHDEIRRAIWGDDTHVDVRERVHYCVKQIRAALDDRASARRVIETVPGRGYRLKRDAVLAATDQPVAPRDAPAVPERDGSLRSRRPRWLAVACLGLSLG